MPSQFFAHMVSIELTDIMWVYTFGENYNYQVNVILYLARLDTRIRSSPVVSLRAGCEV